MKKAIIYLMISVMMIMITGCNPVFTDKQVPSPDKASPNTITPLPEGMKATPSPLPTVEPEPTITSAPISTIPEQSGSSDAEVIAKEVLSRMTLEEKVGQLFFVRCRQDTAQTDIESYHLGGFILFSGDFEDETKPSMIEKIKKYQELSRIPMLIGVDEEGGIVNRVSKYPSFRSNPFESPQALYQSGGFNRIAEDTIEKSTLLKSLGINVNLAPVCDLSTDPADFIYPRTFGKDAYATSLYVKTVVEAMNSMGLGCTLKHFPGYGNNVDTHTEIATDVRSFDNFMDNDFLPFEAGIKAGAGSILVSHNIVTSMDKDYPASLSKKVHRILRADLGFEGVIMTDDLSMDAITEYTGNQEAAVLAVNAGNDIVIATDFDVQIPAVIAAVQDHTISKERIDEAVLRVLLWKLSLKLSVQ